MSENPNPNNDQARTLDFGNQVVIINNIIVPRQEVRWYRTTLSENFPTGVEGLVTWEAAWYFPPPSFPQTRFTATIEGIYLVSLQVQFDTNGLSTGDHVFLRLDRTGHPEYRVTSFLQPTLSSSEQTVQLNGMVYMHIGEELWVTIEPHLSVATDLTLLSSVPGNTGTTFSISYQGTGA